MPRPPRAPRPPRLPAPRPPSPPRLSLGRLNLAPIRAQGSTGLDASTPVPFIRWDAFRARIRFRQGEHITIVGTTGSGKTVLMRELLEDRDYTAVLGTKNEDPELYGPYEARGYEITTEFNPNPDADQSRIIFRPRLRTPNKAGLKRQGEAFEAMLFEVWEYGGWTVAADELYVLCDKLGLADIFEQFWSAGRTNHITVVGATQLPVSIPLMAFDQAKHLFLFRNTDQYRIKRMSEFAGADSRVLRELIPRLPRHEFVYIDTREGTMLRSMVLL